MLILLVQAQHNTWDHLMLFDPVCWLSSGLQQVQNVTGREQPSFSESAATGESDDCFSHTTGWVTFVLSPPIAHHDMNPFLLCWRVGDPAEALTLAKHNYLSLHLRLLQRSGGACLPALTLSDLHYLM